jgi:hypothetical protein
MMTNTEAAKKLVEEGWLMLPAKDEFGYFTEFIHRERSSQNHEVG